jgi:TRAP-type transport system periplasmic protein
MKRVAGLSKSWGTLGVLAIGGFAIATGKASAAEYRWLNSWDKTIPHISLLIEPYQKAVEAASKGTIKFIVSGPETVPAFEQLQPVAAGAFQFLNTHGAYHFGTSPLLAVIEAIGGTPEQRRASGIFDQVDIYYQKLGLKIIAMPMGPDGGYQIILRQPLTANGDLAGRKIRGNATYANVIKMLGASTVTMPPVEIYTALDKGVIDGFAFTTNGIIGTRFYEVSKYLLRPAFGFGTLPILMNLATWNKLPEPDKKVLLDEGKKASEKWMQDATKLIADEEKELLAKGLTIIQMNDASKAKLKQAWSEGLWEIAGQKAKKEVDELRALAKSKGLD